MFPESRKLEHWVPDDVAAALPATFARYEPASIAQALVLGLRLFRRLALEVAAASGLDYPAESDAAIEAWVLARLREGGLEIA